MAARCVVMQGSSVELPEGRLCGCDNGGTTTLQSYVYLGLDTVVEEDDPQDGINLSYIGSTPGDGGDRYSGLDRFGRIIAQLWTNGTGGTGTVVEGYTYTYDADGNVLTKDNVVADAASNNSFDQTYTYDGMNELTSADNGTSNVQSYTLDALGNITSLTNGTSSAVTSTFNAQNELVTDGAATLDYDNNGNTTVDDQGDTLVYDAWNRLIAVNNTAGATIALYGYNGVGQRVTTEDTGNPQTQLYYDASDQLVESHVANSGLSLQSSYIWSAGSGYQNALVLRDFDFSGNGVIALDERDYALQDANWNVTALVGYQPSTADADADGTVDSADYAILLANDGHRVAGGAAVGDFNDDGTVDNSDLVTLLTHYGTSGTGSWQLEERFVYTPYGVFTAYTPSFTVRSNGDFLAFSVTFQGMLYDTTTKLNFTMTRVYEASTGRFLTVDPSGLSGMNNYWAFGSNPVSRVDPSGEFWSWLAAGIGAGIGAAISVTSTVVVSELGGHGFPSKGQIAGAAVSGAITGGIIGGTAGALTGDPTAAIAIAAIAGGLGAAWGSYTQQEIDNGTVDPDQVAKAGLVGAVSSAATAGLLRGGGPAPQVAGGPALVPAIDAGLEGGAPALVGGPLAVMAGSGSNPPDRQEQEAMQKANAEDQAKLDDIGRQIAEEAAKFKNLECHDAALAIKEVLTRNGQGGTLISIDVEGGNGFIIQEGKNLDGQGFEQTISENGHHEVVEWNGKVYDAFNPDGIDKGAYLDSLHSTGTITHQPVYGRYAGE